MQGWRLLLDVERLKEVRQVSGPYDDYDLEYDTDAAADYVDNHANDARGD